MPRRRLTVRAPEGGAVIRNLERDRRHGVEVTAEPAIADDGSGQIPPGPGTVVYFAPSIDALQRVDLVGAVVGAAGGEDERVVITVEHAAALPPELLESALDAAEHTPREVVLSVLRDG